MTSKHGFLRNRCNTLAVPTVYMLVKMHARGTPRSPSRQAPPSLYQYKNARPTPSHAAVFASCCSGRRFQDLSVSSPHGYPSQGSWLLEHRSCGRRAAMTLVQERAPAARFSASGSRCPQNARSVHGRLSPVCNLNTTSTTYNRYKRILRWKWGWSVERPAPPRVVSHPAHKATPRSRRAIR